MRVSLNTPRTHQANTMGDTPLFAASGLVIEKQGESPGTPDEVAQAVKLLFDWR